jgi:hypothetical protein
MEKKTKGAWILHHAQKLQTTTSQDFDAIAFAGKCGTLLSAISASSQAQLPKSQVDALAKANNISPKTEVPAILTELERQRLIDRGSAEIEVLGLTTSTVLEYTSTVFDETDHESYEDAVIEVSDTASETPLTDAVAKDRMSDEFKMTSSSAADVIVLATNIGFFDAEAISEKERLLFNGNLFKRDEAKKINAVLASLKPNEAAHLREINERLHKAGCLPLKAATDVLGEPLFGKLHSIGLFDVSVVGNESGKNWFVTRPAAFSKFTNSIADDALDLAKALVASLTYGMTVSSFYRGRIQMIDALMRKLINGGTVGPATAIGSDYQALELKGVVKVTPSTGGMFTMRLMKPEVGRLALAVIQDGDITAESIAQIPGARVTEYVNPERTREIRRRESAPAVKVSTRNLLNEIRTGGLGR